MQQRLYYNVIGHKQLRLSNTLYYSVQTFNKCITRKQIHSSHWICIQYIASLLNRVWAFQVWYGRILGMAASFYAGHILYIERCYETCNAAHFREHNTDLCRSRNLASSTAWTAAVAVNLVGALFLYSFISVNKWIKNTDYSETQSTREDTNGYKISLTSAVENLKYNNKLSNVNAFQTFSESTNRRWCNYIIRQGIPYVDFDYTITICTSKTCSITQC